MQTPIKRGNCLSFFLSLMVLANAVIAFYFLGFLLGFYKDASALPTWMLIFSVAVCIGNLACAVGTFKWKRWGVFGYGALALASYIANVAVTGNFTNIVGLAGSGILVALVLPNWKNMG